MQANSFQFTKKTCYFSYLSMAAIFALPSLLFVHFREAYNLSYTLLGSLILINFCTQMGIDLIFTFFTKYFNIKYTLRTMPFLTAVGFLIYAMAPTLFPNHIYIGLSIGTVLFSLSAGLAEVLLSPLIAAIPAEHPEKEMSLLHSLYAWGVVSVIVISTLFFKLFGIQNWSYLALFYALLSLITGFLFCMAPIPKMDMGTHSTGEVANKRTIGLMLCVACIFLGSAAENVMTNWVSSYLENALKISKTYGDILGMAVFAIFLGSARALYAKYSFDISKTLLIGMIGATVCYATVAFCSNVYVVLFACVMTGFCTSMLWPGTLILMEEKILHPGVAAYALMAASGDCGASLAPQLMGIITDNVSESSFALTLGQALTLSPEQIGMKAGMLVTAVFPLLGILLLCYIRKYFSSHKNVLEKQ